MVCHTLASASSSYHYYILEMRMRQNMLISKLKFSISFVSLIG